jgi:hypothetical protein
LQTALEVDFVRDEHNRFFTLQSGFGDSSVLIAWVQRTINDNEDDIGKLGRLCYLFLDTGFKFVFGAFKTGGINKPEGALIERYFPYDVVTGRSRFTRNNRLL